MRGSNRVQLPLSPESTGEPSSTGVRKAIILAAGMGERLRPFTDHSPKCLALVNDTPILVNALSHLHGVGVTEVIVVVGHRKERIFEHVGDSFKGMKITYIVSEVFATTNNIYSFWLAREHLVEDVFLIEGDVFFERSLLERLLSHKTKSLMAVSQHQSWMSGTVVSVDTVGNVQAIIEGHEQGTSFDYSNLFKSANIYLFRKEFLRKHFVPHLEAHIASGDIDQYYEIILHAMAHRGKQKLRAIQCDDLRWYEIDDESDRVAAEYLFASQDKRYDFISKQHGGYWRYDFGDHAFLYNDYFPPQSVFTHFNNVLHDLVLNYPVSQTVLAGLVSTWVNHGPDRIVVSNGASELIKIIANQLDRRMIVPVPSFNEYENAVPEDKLVRFALRPPSFQLNVDAFAEEAGRCEASVAVVVTPNNPTSLSVSKPDLCRLAAKLADQDCLLIVDESFTDFSENPDELTMKQEIDSHPNLAILKSMSKAFGIGGLRLGYLVTANHDLAARIRNEIPIWNINGFAESFLRLIPRYRREFIRSCREVNLDQIELYERLQSIPGMIAYKPEANFVFCRVPNSAPSGPEVTRALFVEHNILIKHCAGKSMPESDRYLRIASRTSAANLKLVEALESVIGAPSGAGGSQ